MSGARSHAAGLAAEEAVARRYAAAGFDIAARRWRGRGGEIDLVARLGPLTVFVEVKRAGTHARAAAAISCRQVRRLFDAAGEYMGGLPGGLDSEVRFDAALVAGPGEIEIVENALQTLH